MARLMLCKYDVDDIKVIFGDGSTETIPKGNVSKIMIEKDFNNFFPILSVDCIVSRKIYDRIIKNITNIKYRVRLEKFYIRNDEPTVKKTFAKTVIDNVFVDINQDVSPNPNNNLQKNMPESESSPEKDIIEMSLFLFIEDHIHRYRQLNNMILSGSMSDAIVHLCSSCGIKKLLLSNPDNMNTYDEIIIDSATLLGNIENLQNVYGIYNKGYNMFDDFDTTYIINKTKQCTAYRNGEFPKVFINVNESDGTDSVNIGLSEDTTNRCYQINVSKPPTILNKSNEVKEVLFDKVAIVNPYNGNVHSQKLNINSSSANTIKLFEDRYNNSVGISAEVYRLEENNSLMSVNIDETDIDVFTVNKEFYFNMKLTDKSYDKHSKTYKLNNFVANITRGRSEYMSCNMIANFKSV